METPISLANPEMGRLEQRYVTDALLRGELSGGAYNERFEELLKAHLGKPTIACSSGTAALHLALLAEGIGPGDEVIVPALTYAATASVVKNVGATVVLVDVDERGLIDLRRVDGEINRHTKAVMPVDLYGQCCGSDWSPWTGLTVIVDQCESFHLPARGDYAAFSFYPNKHITTGEGGALAGNALSKARLFRDQGMVEPYVHLVSGLNYRLTNIQAAIGCAQMERADKLIEARKRCVQWYKDRVKGLGEWMFVARVDDPHEAMNTLRNDGIESRPVFKPLHRLPPYKQEGEFPNADKLWKTHIVVPTGPHLSEEDVDRICNLLINRCGSSSASTQDNPSPTTSSNKASPSELRYLSQSRRWL